MQPPHEEHVQRHLCGLLQDAGSQLARRLCGAHTLLSWFPAADTVNVGIRRFRSHSINMSMMKLFLSCLENGGIGMK